MLRFAIEVDGAQVFDRAFNRIESQIKDLRPIWPDAEQEFFRIELGQFQTEGTQGASGTWKSLKDTTEESKARSGFLFSTILRRTDALYMSLTRKGAPHQVYEADEQSLTIGTSLPYAQLHQRGQGKLPARPVISLSEESKRKLIKAIQRPLVDFARKEGFTQTQIGEI